MSDLGPEARSILKAGRDGDDPRPSDRARVRRKIARSIAAGGAIGAASAAGSAAGKGLSAALLAKVLGGVLFAGALGAGIWAASAPSMSGAPAAASVAVSGSASAAAAPVSPGTAGMPFPEPPAPVSGAPAAPAPPPGGAAPKAAAGAPAAAAPAGTDDTLVDETRGLREAHGALKSGDARKALQLLDEQSAAYDQGQLRQERAATRVLILCKLGRGDEARAAAAEFLRDNPRSPLADRVRGGCPAGAGAD